jgi:transposase
MMATRTEAAKIGGVGLQIIRDWMLRFNARGPDGLLDGKSPGQPSKLNDAQRQAIVRMIASGPIPAVYGVVRWRLIDLAQWIFEEFPIAVAKQTLSRELRAMGYRKLSARPRHHAQDARWQIEAAPDEHTEMRYPNRASESAQPSSRRFRLRHCASRPTAPRFCDGTAPAGLTSLTTNIRIHETELALKPGLKCYDDLVDHCCMHGTSLSTSPGRSYP